MPVRTEHRYNVRAYYRMAESGVLPPDARVELLNGIVNYLNEATLEVYREPHFTGYSSRTVLGKGDQVAPLAFRDAVINGDELLKR
jgi:hypothetical protein